MDLNLTTLVHGLTKMGCMCFKPSVVVEGVTYRVNRQLAEGGFSTVDLVEDTSSGKKYAMKRITCHSTEDQNLATKEVEITRSLDHPNIVKVVGVSTSGTADIVHNTTSQVCIVFPFYQVITAASSHTFQAGRFSLNFFVFCFEVFPDKKEFKLIRAKHVVVKMIENLPL